MSIQSDPILAGAAGGVPAELPLFPLRTVLFPGGLLELKIFEARYLDLVARCLREQSTFGVVALRAGGEARNGGDDVALHEVGTRVELLEVDAVQAGLLTVRARGAQRFSLSGPRQEQDGLWVGQAATLADDPLVAPRPDQARLADGLRESIDALAGKGIQPFLEPFEFGHAGWVANRWAELLPLPLSAKQRLLVSDDPLLRLDAIAICLSELAAAAAKPD